MKKVLVLLFALSLSSLSLYAKDPLLKVEGDYQKLMTDIQGFRFSAEAGLILIRAETEYTRYMEDNPSNQYEIFATHLLYSIGLGDLLRVHLAGGYKKFFNAVRNDGLDIGAALTISPVEKLRFEGKAFFSIINSNNNNVIPDFRTGVRYKVGPLGLRAGYRYIRIQSRDLQGPFVGLALEI